jgi:hypothetical protein
MALRHDLSFYAAVGLAPTAIARLPYGLNELPDPEGTSRAGDCEQA